MKSFLLTLFLTANLYAGSVFCPSSGGMGGGGGSGTVTSVSGTGTAYGLTLTGTVTTSGSITLGGTLDLASPGPIGGDTPAAGSFTELSINALSYIRDDGSLSLANGGAGFDDEGNATVRQLNTDGEVNLNGGPVLVGDNLTVAEWVNTSVYKVNGVGGVSGSFQSQGGETITVAGGIITAITPP